MTETARRPCWNSFITKLGVLDGRPKRYNIDDDDGAGNAATLSDDTSRDDGDDDDKDDNDSWSICRAQFATSAETTSAAAMISL